MGFAKFVLGEPFNVKSYFKIPEAEREFALELEKVQGSIAQAGVQEGQKKWWVSTVLASLVTPPEAAPQSCFCCLEPFFLGGGRGGGSHFWDILNVPFISKEEKKLKIESISDTLWVIFFGALITAFIVHDEDVWLQNLRVIESVWLEMTFETSKSKL